MMANDFELLQITAFLFIVSSLAITAYQAYDAYRQRQADAAHDTLDKVRCLIKEDEARERPCMSCSNSHIDCGLFHVDEGEIHLCLCYMCTLLALNEDAECPACRKRGWKIAMLNFSK